MRVETNELEDADDRGCALRVEPPLAAAAFEEGKRRQINLRSFAPLEPAAHGGLELALERFVRAGVLGGDDARAPGAMDLPAEALHGVSGEHVLSGIDDQLARELDRRVAVLRRPRGERFARDGVDRVPAAIAARGAKGLRE